MHSMYLISAADHTSIKCSRRPTVPPCACSPHTHAVDRDREGMRKNIQIKYLQLLWLAETTKLHLSQWRRQGGASRGTCPAVKTCAPAVPRQLARYTTAWVKLFSTSYGYI